MPDGSVLLKKSKISQMQLMHSSDLFRVCSYLRLRESNIHVYDEIYGPTLHAHTILKFIDLINKLDSIYNNWPMESNDKIHRALVKKYSEQITLDQIIFINKCIFPPEFNKGCWHIKTVMIFPIIEPLRIDL